MHSEHAEFSPPEAPPRVGISSCLLGQEVRYDGGHKRDAFIVERLGRWVEWVPVCPEIELGLGAPRPPMRLDRVDGLVRLRVPSSGEDLTDRMESYATARAAELGRAGLSGYVLKTRSPSCGIDGVKLFRSDEQWEADGRGLFAEQLMHAAPTLPVIEEEGLADSGQRETFLAAVSARRRWLAMRERQIGLADLQTYHARHKFVLLARDPETTRRLGRMLAEEGKRNRPGELAAAYEERFAEVMRCAPSRGGHVNTLQHLAGFVSDAMSSSERAELHAAIADYRSGSRSRLIALRLIQDAAREQGIEYLRDQAYLWPEPLELAAED